MKPGMVKVTLYQLDIWRGRSERTNLVRFYASLGPYKKVKELENILLPSSLLTSHVLLAGFRFPGETSELKA